MDEYLPGIGAAMLRAAIAYVVMLTAIRLGPARLRGLTTPFDFVVSIIIGSLVANAVSVEGLLLPGLSGAIALVIMHWLVAMLSYRLPWFRDITLGESVLLVERGSIQWAAMRRSYITERDLLEAMHKQGLDDIRQVEEARLERGGDISVVPFETEKVRGVD